MLYYQFFYLTNEVSKIKKLLVKLFLRNNFACQFFYYCYHYSTIHSKISFNYIFITLSIRLFLILLIYLCSIYYFYPIYFIYLSYNLFIILNL